jgi:hypothetical protein
MQDGGGEFLGICCTAMYTGLVILFFILETIWRVNFTLCVFYYNKNKSTNGIILIDQSVFSIVSILLKNDKTI